MVKSFLFSLTLFLLLPSFVVGSDSSCIGKALQTLVKTLDGINVQEHIWELRRAGKYREAKAMEDEIIKILNSEALKSSGLGQSSGGARLYHFDQGVSAVGKRKGAHWTVNVDAEVAVYKIDRLYDINLVPITISREINGRVVSLQLFYQGAKDSRFVKVVPNSIDKKKMEVLDYLIDNLDRREPNWLVTEGGRIVAIDHGVSLHNARKVPYSPFPPRLHELDLNFLRSPEGKRLIDKMRTVTNKDLTTELGALLPQKEIEKIIKRRDELLRLLDQDK